MKVIPYGKQFIDQHDKDVVKKSLDENLITTGNFVNIFEKKIKNYLKVKYAVSCSSGTSALHLAMLSINLKKNDVIIMPAVNFISAFNMATNLGAKIYLADVDSITGQITPETIKKCIQNNKIKKIKAVITMYMGGYPNNIINFYKLKKKYKFIIIEDACHALGSRYRFRNKFLNIGSCNHSDICTFSLHPLKTITTGEGGIITTNSKKIYNNLYTARSHGIIKSKKNHWMYDIKNSGFNYRLSDLNCALGVSQLNKINLFLRSREKIAKTYIKNLNNFQNLTFCIDLKNIKPSFHLFIINIDFTKLKKKKDDLLNYLKTNNIICQYHYIPIYKFKIYKKKIKKNSFLGSEKYYKNSLSIPIFYDLKLNNQRKVISKIKFFLEKNNLK